MHQSHYQPEHKRWDRCTIEAIETEASRMAREAIRNERWRATRTTTAGSSNIRPQSVRSEKMKQMLTHMLSLLLPSADHRSASEMDIEKMTGCFIAPARIRSLIHPSTAHESVIVQTMQLRIACSRPSACYLMNNNFISLRTESKYYVDKPLYQTFLITRLQTPRRCIVLVTDTHRTFFRSCCVSLPLVHLLHFHAPLTVYHQMVLKLLVDIVN
jgi:hypothetical protein